MVDLSFRVLAYFKNDRIETITYPANGAVLNRQIRALVSVVRMKENLLCFFETDSTPRIAPKTPTLPLVEVESHGGITLISHRQEKRKRAESNPLRRINSGIGAKSYAIEHAWGNWAAGAARVMYNFRSGDSCRFS
jgi:hypothetical protein